MKPLTIWAGACVLVCILSGWASQTSAGEGAQDREQPAEGSGSQGLSMQAIVEKALVRYLQVGKGEYAAGYFGADGVFYKFKAEEPLKAEQLPVKGDERAWRVVSEPREVAEIDRPVTFSFVEWANGLVPVHFVHGTKTALIFVGVEGKSIADLLPAPGQISGLRVDSVEDILAAGFTVVEIRGRPAVHEAGKSAGAAT